MSPDLSQRMVSVRGPMFSIEVTAGGSGRPTLYFHDELLPPVAYPWLSELARTRQVIAPQHPGFGRSTGLEHLDDVVDLAIYYLDFLDTLQLAQVDLIGASFGGMVAAEVAALAPQRVRRLVLVSPLGLWLDQSPVLDVFGVSTPELHQATWAQPDGPVAQPFAPDSGTEAEQQRAWIEHMRSLAAAGKFVWPIPDKGLRRRIHRIGAPTLLLWGANDRIVPLAYAQAFRDKLRSAEIATIPGAGHLPLVEQPAATLAVVNRFLDG